MSLIFSPAILDIVLSFNAWRTLKYTQTFRYLLKLAFAAFWLVVMPIAYSRSVQNPRGIIRFFNTLGGNWQTQSLYYYCVAIYLVPNILSAILFLLPCLRRSMERSNWRIISILMWWSQASRRINTPLRYRQYLVLYALTALLIFQPKLYVGRGMHEDMLSLLK